MSVKSKTRHWRVSGAQSTNSNGFHCLVTLRPSCSLNVCDCLVFSIMIAIRATFCLLNVCNCLFISICATVSFSLLVRLSRFFSFGDSLMTGIFASFSFFLFVLFFRTDCMRTFFAERHRIRIDSISCPRLWRADP